MLNFLKKYLKKEPLTETEDIKLTELERWFQNKVKELSFRNYLEEYVDRLKELKEQIERLNQTLINQELSKDDKKQVEERVKNIVLGQRKYYTSEIERFLTNLELPEVKIESLADYQKLIKFNAVLNKELDELAKRTAKSYQATQHLFFKQVEPIYKLLREVSQLIANFKKKVEENNLNKIEALQNLISALRDEESKLVEFKKELQENKEEQTKVEKEKNKEKQQLNKLKERAEFTEYQQLLKKQENLQQQIKITEHLVFSFFSKLNKALKKYERQSLHDKLIRAYLEDSIKTFRGDKELEVMTVLDNLEKALQEDKLALDAKQTDKLSSLIKDNNLKKLKEKLVNLNEQQEQIKQQLKEKIINEKIKEQQNKLSKLTTHLETLKNNISEVTDKLSKIDLEKVKSEIKDKIKIIFNKEVTFSS